MTAPRVSDEQEFSNAELAYITSINDAGTYCRTLWVAFISYVAIAFVLVSGVNDEQLLLELPMKLPLFDLGVPLKLFFIVVPLLLVLFHFNLLMKLNDLRVRIRPLNLSGSTKARRAELRRRLVAIDYLFVEEGLIVNRLESWFLSLTNLITIFVLPVILLLYVQLQFLPYHSATITWLQRALILVDMFLGFAIEFGIRGGAARSIGWSEVRAATVAVVVTFTSVCLLAFPGEPQDIVWGAEQSGQGFDPAETWGIQRSLILFGRIFPKASASPDRQSAGNTGLDGPTRSEKPIDLAGRDLSFGTFVGSSFAGANLTFANLHDATFAFVNFDGARLLGVDASCAQFWKASFRGANLSGAHLDCAQFDGADLTGASLVLASMKASELNGAKLEGADLRNADLRASSFQDAMLVASDLEGANLVGANFSDSNMQAASLATAHFWHTVLGKSLTSADLSDLVRGAPYDPQKLVATLAAEAAPIGNWSAAMTQLFSIKYSPEFNGEFTSGENVLINRATLAAFLPQSHVTAAVDISAYSSRLVGDLQQVICVTANTSQLMDNAADSPLVADRLVRARILSSEDQLDQVSDFIRDRNSRKYGLELSFDFSSDDITDPDDAPRPSDQVAAIVMAVANGSCLGRYLSASDAIRVARIARHITAETNSGAR